MQHPAQRMTCSLGLVCAMAFPAEICLGQDQRQTQIQSELKAAQAAIEGLRTEIAQLRQDVMRLELERHREILRQTKAELESVHAERAQLAELEKAREQDLRELEALQVDRDVTVAERSEVEISRAEISFARAKEIDRLSEQARGREDGLLLRQRTQEQFIQRLEEALKVTGGKSQ